MPTSCKIPRLEPQCTTTQQQCPREKTPVSCCPEEKNANCSDPVCTAGFAPIEKICSYLKPCQTPMCQQPSEHHQIYCSKSVQVNSSLSFPKKSSCTQNKEMKCSATAKHRNAYLNFLEEFRRYHKHLLPWQVMSQAACCWKNLDEQEKCRYRNDAQSAKYIYASKNRALNKVLRTLRCALKSPEEIDVRKLAAVSNQLQTWKQEVLECIQ